MVSAAHNCYGCRWDRAVAARWVEIIKTMNLLDKLPPGTLVIKRKFGWAIMLTNNYVDYNRLYVRGEKLKPVLKDFLTEYERVKND